MSNNAPNTDNAPYKEMYLHLFRAAERAVRILDAAQEFSKDTVAVREILIQAQQQCEEMYLDAEE